MATYLEVRLFTYDSERDGVYVPGGGQSIEGEARSFANLANASAVYADCKRVVDRAIERGLHEQTDRARPGPQHRTRSKPKRRVKRR